MTEAWVQSLFDEEPEAYGPKPRDITKGIPNKALAHSPTKGNSWGPDETKIMYENPNGAPPLDWWKVSEEEVHRRLILAMCPERVCRTCGEPSRRITEATFTPDTGHPERSKPRPLDFSPENIERQHQASHALAAGPEIRGIGTSFKYGRAVKHVETVGWTDCGHDDWRPGVVLDPFA